MRSALLLSSLVFSGCVTATSLTPVASLREVERPASARERYGEQAISRVSSDSGLTRYSFEDRLIRGLFLLQENGVAFEVTNKTEFSIKLVWDEATIVLPEGDPSPVMHVGTKYNECRNAKPATVIPKGATVSDIAIPCARVRFGYDSWVEGDVFRDFQRRVFEPVADTTIKRLVRSVEGKIVRLLLPLQIEGVTNEYSFTFGVDSVSVIRPPKR